MELNIIKNTEAAPNLGGLYGQDVEPTGTYVREKVTDMVPPNWVQGKAKLNNPLVIDISDNEPIAYKKELSKQYNAKGKKLTSILMSKGYDSIITRYPDGSKGEIVLCPNAKFMMAESNKALIKNLLKESIKNLK
jgi:hypothetical protein